MLNTTVAHIHVHTQTQPIMQFPYTGGALEGHGRVVNQIRGPPTHTSMEQTGTSHSNNQHRLAFLNACLNAIKIWRLERNWQLLSLKHAYVLFACCFLHSVKMIITKQSIYYDLIAWDYAILL